MCVVFTLLIDFRLAHSVYIRAYDLPSVLVARSGAEQCASALRAAKAILELSGSGDK